MAKQFIDPEFEALRADIERKQVVYDLLHDLNFKRSSNITISLLPDHEQYGKHSHGGIECFHNKELDTSIFFSIFDHKHAVVVWLGNKMIPPHATSLVGLEQSIRQIVKDAYVERLTMLKKYEPYIFK